MLKFALSPLPICTTSLVNRKISMFERDEAMLSCFKNRFMILVGIITLVCDKVIKVKVLDFVKHERKINAIMPSFLPNFCCQNNLIVQITHCIEIDKAFNWLFPIDSLTIMCRGMV